MNIAGNIERFIKKVERVNAKKTEEYKAELKKTIAENLIQKKQPIEKNQHLIDKYYGAKPKDLTTMQLALKAAAEDVQCTRH